MFSEHKTLESDCLGSNLSSANEEFLLFTLGQVTCFFIYKMEIQNLKKQNKTENNKMAIGNLQKKYSSTFVFQGFCED